MSGNSVPLWIAKEQGFFREYGLDPQLIFIIAGRAAQAMPESSRRGFGIKTTGSTRIESQGRPAQARGHCGHEPVQKVRRKRLHEPALPGIVGLNRGVAWGAPTSHLLSKS